MHKACRRVVACSALEDLHMITHGWRSTFNCAGAARANEIVHMRPQAEIRDAIIAKDAFGLQPAKTELTDDTGMVFFPGNDGLSSFDIEVQRLAAHSLFTGTLF